MKLLSVIIPAFNEESNILFSYHEIIDVLETNNINFELIYINDGSKDNSWLEIKKLLSDSRVKAINFSRNFGKEAALEAGLRNSVGDCAVIIDCDMQHPPESILGMYRLWENGYEIIEGKKVSRGEERSGYKFFSKLFYKMISIVTHFDMENSSDFKLLDRKVINELNKLSEKERFFRALTFWVGFKRAIVEFDVQERINGESKWSIIGLVRYAISNITSFTSAPLQLITILGMVYFIFATLLGGYSIFKYIIGDSLEGFTTVIILLLIVGGTITISIGVLGIYINKVFNEIKNRPSYIISEFLGQKSKINEK